ncbi:glycosyltransferase [Rubellimicrobium roseum]|uniref:glycosyltransferase n=1 Tax=Rubellimicrobium roseum TaxID=687525 RepID=UPI00159BC206
MHLSIVTAVYNRADTIADAVRSLREESLTDWGHVVQDGASTDGTLDVLAGLADGRTCVKSGRDGGICDALNRSLPAPPARWASCTRTNFTPPPIPWLRWSAPFLARGGDQPSDGAGPTQPAPRVAGSLPPVTGPRPDRATVPFRRTTEAGPHRGPVRNHLLRTS